MKLQPLSSTLRRPCKEKDNMGRHLHDIGIFLCSTCLYSLYMSETWTHARYLHLRIEEKLSAREVLFFHDGVTLLCTCRILDTRNTSLALSL